LDHSKFFSYQQLTDRQPFFGYQKDKKWCTNHSETLYEQCCIQITLTELIKQIN
jgi:hypothetical protein